MPLIPLLKSANTPIPTFPDLGKRIRIRINQNDVKLRSIAIAHHDRFNMSRLTLEYYIQKIFRGELYGSIKYWSYLNEDPPLSKNCRRRYEQASVRLAHIMYSGGINEKEDLIINIRQDVYPHFEYPPQKGIPVEEIIRLHNKRWLEKVEKEVNSELSSEEKFTYLSPRRRLETEKLINKLYIEERINVHQKQQRKWKKIKERKQEQENIFTINQPDISVEHLEKIISS